MISFGLGLFSFAVFLQAASADGKSAGFIFSNKYLAAFTAASPCPFDLGLYGEDVSCTIPFRLQYSSKWNAEYPCDFVQDISDCLCSLIEQHIDPDISAVPVLGDHVRFAPSVKQIDGDLLHREAGQCRDERFDGFAQPQLLAGLAFVDHDPDVVFHRRPVV